MLDGTSAGRYDAHPQPAQMLGPVLIKPFSSIHLCARWRLCCEGSAR
jgi:hypothetical protein